MSNARNPLQIFRGCVPSAGGFEIAEPEVGSLFTDQVHQLTDAQELAGVGDAYFPEVPVGSILKFRHWIIGQAGLADQAAQRFISSTLSVIPRGNEIVDGGPAAVAADDPQAFQDILERIIVRAVIGSIDGGPGRVKAHADGIKAGVTKRPPHPAGCRWC